jgi:putative transcriptional regulator
VTEPRLGNRLKQLRTEQGWTQAELAEIVGVSRKTINTVENGVFVPSTLLALQIAKTLKTSVEKVFFIGESDK